MNPTKDQIYIEKVLLGDASSFSFLVESYKEMAYTIALKIVRSPEDAEEVAQDSFVKAFQQLQTFKGNSKFSTWLYTIVYRTAISKIRKKKLEVTDIDEYVIENHSIDFSFPQLDLLKAEEQKKYVTLAINALAELDALLITLFYLNENTFDEIIEITGLTKTNIKVRLFRARKKLYKELSKILKTELKTIL
ncbi:MAG: RNA polymerase sigma factor [Flavobacteriaceae bacterium]|nr:RNA polymerase sigma factor [Flavobacteriaceae bacterium]